jgi:hypothetical protein
MDGECIGKDPAVGEADESSVNTVAFLDRFGTATSPDGSPAAAEADAASACGGGFFKDDVSP